MKATDSPKEISLETLRTHLNSYDSHVPEKIQGLEEIRLRTIPETLAQRKKDGKAFLEKAEVISLVEWKLKHGTYRPNLAKLVASNSVKDIREATESAFEAYEANNDEYAKSVTVLSKLKGIGPATASLLLSSYDPVKVPFFSDELFRYLHWEEAKNKGWDRKISYTAKEYKDLFSRVSDLRSRLERDSKTQVSVLDLEKAAYALGKSSTKFPLDAEDAEGDKALRPPSPKRRKRNTSPPKERPDDNFSRISECERKGLNGFPTYDKLGFELDKEYIIKHTSGRPRPLGKRALERLQQKGEDRKRKAEILGLPKEKADRITYETIWDDRVAKDLGIAFHTVGMEEYEEWQNRGFKANPEDFENISKEEDDRLNELQAGCALRKGSKHR